MSCIACQSRHDSSACEILYMIVICIIKRDHHNKSAIGYNVPEQCEMIYTFTKTFRFTVNFNQSMRSTEAA